MHVDVGIGRGLGEILTGKKRGVEAGKLRIFSRGG